MKSSFITKIFPIKIFQFVPSRTVIKVRPIICQYLLSHMKHIIWAIWYGHFWTIWLNFDYIITSLVKIGWKGTTTLPITKKGLSLKCWLGVLIDDHVKFIFWMTYFNDNRVLFHQSRLTHLAKWLFNRYLSSRRLADSEKS